MSYCQQHYSSTSMWFVFMHGNDKFYGAINVSLDY